MTRLSEPILVRHPHLQGLDLEVRLRALVDKARRPWPELASLDEVTFIAHVAERLPEGDGASAALDALYGSDLFLACACAHQLPAALAAFDRHVLSGIDGTVSRVDSDRDFLDEVRQRLRERLLVGAHARIGEYRGAGPLHGWTLVAAMRTALNTRREMRRKAELQRKAELRPQPPPERDPELNLIYARYSARVEKAFRAAFALLPAPHRELLRLHYVEGLTHERIAQKLGIERSTLSRRIGASRRFLLLETHRALRRLVPAMTTASLASLLGAVRSRIDLNLKSLLRA